MRSRFCFCLVFLVEIYAELSGQVIRPYLQSPTDTSVWITWKTDSNAESKVSFGEDSASLSNFVTGTCQILSDIGYNNNYYYHSVQLTGLEPDNFYYYRIKTGTQTSITYRFRTQPRRGNSPGIYRVFVFGDHQVKSDDRYERLLKAAREKVMEKYGDQVEDHINLIINDGDQVDAGTLDQYEHVHFKPSAVLSGNIPIMTTVGNHELAGSRGLPLYHSHFFYDDLGYKGIVSPGGEDYYSYQEKNIVFIHLSTEHPTDEQVAWVQEIIDSVKSDQMVDWVVTLAHRPIQAEQYVGDISLYVRDRILPVLVQTEKSALLISGHHHLYARGQVRDYPMYHIISGGGSWDQYWGQSTEKDFDDVQKTIDYWTYQIVSFDAARKKMAVESYAIGSPKLGMTLNNELIDSFYRKQDLLPSGKPSIISVPADTINLPYTFISSPYITNTSEPFNSVQFQVSQQNNFAHCAIDLIRDYENLYGTTGSPDYLPVDIYKGLDIFRYEVYNNKLPNGPYYIRSRHRDRNIEWSEWSDPVYFIVKGSLSGFASISSPKTIFQPDENIIVNYQFGPGNAKDWIGIYKIGDTPGSTPSTDWEYVNGSSGMLNLNVSEPGKYFLAFFEDDGYHELTDRIYVYIANTPILSLSKPGYENGEEIRVNYLNSTGLSSDWIGIYKIIDTPGVINSTRWNYISGTEGDMIFTGLPDGYYFVTYFLDNGYTEACERIIFSVGSGLARVIADKTIYKAGQTITINYENGPGTTADWIGLLRQNAPPGTAPLVNRQFIENQQSGSLQFNLELEPGEYYAALFINNSSIRISNKANFLVESDISALNQNSGYEDFIIFPSPSTGRFRIKSSKLQHYILSIKISSLTGSIILDKEIDLPSASDSEEIDLSAIPCGIYMIALNTGEELFLKKLVLH